MFYCEFCEIFKKSFLQNTLGLFASVYLPKNIKSKNIRNIQLNINIFITYFEVCVYWWIMISYLEQVHPQKLMIKGFLIKDNSQ